jgi:ATP-dependent Lhr-like helicase
MAPDGLLHPATLAWFRASFPSPTPAQQLGWEAISRGQHTLIHAPTGSGKTLAAFLWVVDHLLHEPQPRPAERCRVLYVSPLKALVYDIDRNLRAPLAGIRHASERIGEGDLPGLTTFLRTGDTPASDRRAMLAHPPDILITTPESLFLILTSEARKVLRPVRYVIVDEIHAVAGTKRGAHLSLSLERLEETVAASPLRIGLSATQRPLETVARFLGGGTVTGPVWTPRPVTIVDAPRPRPLDIEIVVPVEDMSAPAPPDPLGDEEVRVASIWPAVYPKIVDLIQSHRSTIVFANSRRLAERICAEVNSLAGAEICRAHHGSVAREQRIAIEEALKRGELKGVVATSSLELGIDMGTVDLVVQVEAPISVASGLQRVGRAGHQVDGESRARVFPKYRGDLLAATVVVRQMTEGEIEATSIIRNPVDVLSQQLVAMAAIENATADQLFSLVRRAAPYAELGRDVFDATLDMLAGRYPSDLFAELRPRLNWNRVSGEVTARPGARQLAIANAGTIPDRGLYRVVLPDGSRVGELDEEMVYESRVGDTFILGASTWRISDIGPDRVEVIPAPGQPAARMPFWKGDSLGRSFATGERIGRFIREMEELGPDKAAAVLAEQYHLDRLAARNLLAYLDEQAAGGGPLPSDQTLVVERFRDEIGDWRVVVLSPFGARVHAPWAMALTEKLRGTYGANLDVVWADDGIALRFPDADEVPGAADLTLDPEEVRPLLEAHLADTAMFAARFREAASRALMLPRRRPGTRTPLWLQRRRASDLLAVARQFPTFPMVLEAYREILADDFDLPALEKLLADLRARRIRVAETDTAGPSPFSSSLLFAFVAAFLYEADTPLAERRAAALSIDRDLLRSLLGDGELSELISPEAVASVELELQYLTADRKARTLDDLADLLRRLGPLSLEDLEVRSAGLEVAGAVDTLAGSHRAIEVMIGQRELWAAIEDAGRLRDGLGVQPPLGVPFVFLEPVADPLGDLVGRYARTHGPFTSRAVASALSLPTGVVEAALRQLETGSRVGRGSFRPGAETEWVDLEVLRRLKRRSLAELRSQIEPVEPAALGRLLPRWQEAGPGLRRGRSALEAAIQRLQGVEIAASVLSRDVLPSRILDHQPLLDQLTLTGEVVWAGRGALGNRDGKVALYFRDQLDLLWQPPDQEPPQGRIQEALRNHLEQRGASFFRDLYQAAGGGNPEEVMSGLWDLVWAGEVTNDTLAPVRALLAGRGRKPRGGRNQPTIPLEAEGRWSLLSISPAPPTAQAAAWAEVLLERHGIVTRTNVTSEGFSGGFARLYPVMVRLEEIGRIRRGYFVEGLGGAQFALPGAVDRLRSEAESGVVALAAADPANPYGAILAWPKVEGVILTRSPGSYVLLEEGRLQAYLERGRRLALLDPRPELFPAVAAELAGIGHRHRRFTIETIAGEPAHASRLAPALGEWGFVPALRGLTLRP